MHPTETDPIATMVAPDVAKLLADLHKSSKVDGNEARISKADAVRFCQWPNQSPDGKKHDLPSKEAFPWDGASDSRPMLADGVINERAALLVSAFWLAAVKPKASDSEEGQYAVTLADHYINTDLTDRLFSEVALSANHLEQYGVVALNPCWEQKIGLRRVDVTLEFLNQYAQEAARVAEQNGQSQFRLQDLAMMILDPEQEEGAADTLRALYDMWAQQQLGKELEATIPPLRKVTAIKAVKSLRTTGSASIPAPYVQRNGPAIYALRYWDEVWASDDTTDLQDARIIFHREWLTEAALRSKANEGWSEVWINEAVKTAGKALDSAELRATATSFGEVADGSAITDDTTPSDLIEVITAVYKAVDEDGVIGVYQTTFSGHVGAPQGSKEIPYARSELVSYNHGEYPYIGGKAEHWCRRFAASRGVTEVIDTWQQSAKALDDAVVDFTSIAVLPPVNIPKTPLGTKYRFGPAFRNEVMPGREPQFMQVPNSGVPYALTARTQLEARINNHFALMSSEVPPQRWQQSQKLRSTFFLLMWSRALQQMLDLAVQYLPDAEFSKITGAPPGWLDQRRGNLGMLAVTMDFDVRELDAELTLERIKAVNQMVLPADVSGVINRTKWVEIMLRTVNPSWVRELIMPAETASQQIYEGVRTEIAQMFLGNETRYVENDPTATTKLQYSQQIVEANPNYKQALAQGSRFAELMQKYVQNLQFSVTQQQNKQIGRIGVQPEGSK